MDGASGGGPLVPTTTLLAAPETTTTVQPFYDESFSSVSFSFFLNSCFFIALLAILEVLLRRPGTRGFVAPRLNVVLPPGLLSSGLLGWAQLALRSSGSPSTPDPDADVILRFCSLGFKFSMMGSLLDVVLLPLYYYGEGGAQEFNRFSLSNLEMQGSGRFWGTIASAYVLTVGFTYLLLTEWSSFLRMRSAHLARTAGGRSLGGQAAAQASRSVMVELVPPDFREEPAVRAFFDSLFGPGSVHSCTVVTADASTILDHYQPRERAGREVAPAGEPMLPQVDATDAPAVVRGLQQGARRTVQVLQDAVIGRAASSTCFVTFRSVALAIQARQVRLSETGTWRVIEAPEPRDLIWSNVPKPLPQVLLRHSLAQVFCALGIIFWSVPVSLIQGWAQMGNLQSLFPFISKLQSLPWVYSFLTDYLPVMALIGLQCLLPSLFQWMAAGYEGHKTKSEVERIVLNRCFGYQLASLWVTTIAGSIWIELDRILHEPEHLLFLLSSSLPKVAVYFLTYVLTRTGFSLPLLLLRPWEMLPGQRATVVRCAFGSEAANLSLVLVIGLTYSFIAPAILPACALFFGCAYVVYRWLFGYVYEPEFDSRGAFWFDLFNSSLLGLLVGTVALIALAWWRATTLQIIVLAPLPIGVSVFGRWCWIHLGHPSKLIALADAVLADSEESAPDASEVLYCSPRRTRSQPSASG